MSGPYGRVNSLAAVVGAVSGYLHEGAQVVGGDAVVTEVVGIEPDLEDLADDHAVVAANGSSGTTIRAVARAADVDPALVYHYFGSKQRLLDAATDAPPELVESVRHVWQSAPEELGRNLVTNLVRLWADDRVRPGMLATLMAAAHEPTAQAKLKTIVETILMGPAAPDDHERRAKAALVASQMLGLAMTRYVWRIEPITSMTDAQIIDYIAPTIQRYLDL